MEHVKARIYRTYFGSNESWEEILAILKLPEMFGMAPEFEIIEDKKNEGIEGSVLLNNLEEEYTEALNYFFIADEMTFSHKEHPLIAGNVPDLYLTEFMPFRLIPSQVGGVDANLSIANMGFEEFAEKVDADGIFRGFE